MAALDYQQTLFDERLVPSRETMLAIALPPVGLLLLMVVSMIVRGDYTMPLLTIWVGLIATCPVGVLALNDVHRLTVTSEAIIASGPGRLRKRIPLASVASCKATTIKPKFVIFSRECEGIMIRLASSKQFEFRTYRGAELQAVIESLFSSQPVTSARFNPLTNSPPSDATATNTVSDQIADPLLFSEDLRQVHRIRNAALGMAGCTMMGLLCSLAAAYLPISATERVGLVLLWIYVFLVWLANCFNRIETRVRRTEIEVRSLLFSTTINPADVRSIESLLDPKAGWGGVPKTEGYFDQERYEIGRLPSVRLTRVHGIPIRISTARPAELVAALRAVCGHLALPVNWGGEPPAEAGPTMREA